MNKLTKAFGKNLIDNRARAVINIAKDHDIYEGVMPENFEERQKLAETIANRAYNARNNGNKGETVTQILYAWEVELGNEPHDNNGQDKSPEERKYERAIREFTKENLPIPHEIEGEAPLLPLDIESLSNDKIRYLHGAFTACFVRARYLHSVEEAGYRVSRQIYKDKLNKYLISAERKDPETNKPKTMEILKAEASVNDEEIKKWEDRAEEHNIREGKFKALCDLYETSAKALNSEAVMRQMEKKSEY